jgi:phosphatidylserine decarboxylase
MRVAPEGWPFIAIAFAVLAVLAWFRIWPAVVVWLPIAVWVVAFFRDPVRTPPAGDALIVAPADGRVVSVILVDEPTFLAGPAVRIAIFMNVFNVHVNRYPSDGRVAHRHYNPGRFLNAAVDKASTENEQSSIGLETTRGRILIRQIAGLVARRIITDHPVGTAVTRGQRLGLIRFGSRVDVFLPAGSQALVKVGEVTVAGETVIGSWP